MMKVVTYTNRGFLYSVEPASRYTDCGIGEERLEGIVSTYNQTYEKIGWRAAVEVLEEDDPRYPMVRASLFHAQKVEQEAAELVELVRTAIKTLEHGIRSIEKLLKVGSMNSPI